MDNLSEFLKYIIDDKNKKSLLNAPSGHDFEEKIKNNLKKFNFSQMRLDDDEEFKDFIQSIKNEIQDKLYSNIVENTLFKLTSNQMYKDCFVWQPYGSQDYPDFLVITEKYVFPIEIKFSTNSGGKPMWNSNLPKKDGIYIFGRYKNPDLTLFRGEDVLPDDERASIIKIWNDLESTKDNWERDFERSINNGEFINEYGFHPYIRKAYEQGLQFNKNATLDFFDNKKRDDLEKAAIKFIKDMNS